MDMQNNHHSHMTYVKYTLLFLENFSKAPARVTLHLLGAYEEIPQKKKIKIKIQFIFWTMEFREP